MDVKQHSTECVHEEQQVTMVITLAKLHTSESLNLTNYSMLQVIENNALTDTNNK